MRPLTKLVTTELKLFLREPAAAFFTLILPLLLLTLNGGGQEGGQPNAPIPGLGGAGLIDVLLTGYIALVIATTGLTVLPEVLAGYREQGILRRLRATPLRPAAILGAHVLVHVVVTGIGLALLVAVGVTFYDLNPPQAPLAVAVAVLLGAVSTFALSFVLAGALPTPRTTAAAGALLYFPMIFLSGAVFPREGLPVLAQRIGAFLPLTHAVEAMRQPWIGGGWALDSLAVLAALLAGAVAVSSRTFRWQ
jgi:ABC-2 type transport system permease protein